MVGRYVLVLIVFNIICYSCNMRYSTLHNVAHYLSLLLVSIFINMFQHNYSHNYSYNCPSRRIADIRTSTRTISQARRISKAVPVDPIHGRCELDSHADTIVAGSNCLILQYTGKECSVMPYNDKYDPTNNVPIVHAATAYQCNLTGRIYILIFNECLWMGETMNKPLSIRINFGTLVLVCRMTLRLISPCL